jgi:hypothetical protein
MEFTLARCNIYCFAHKRLNVRHTSHRARLLHSVNKTDNDSWQLKGEGQ